VRDQRATIAELLVEDLPFRLRDTTLLRDLFNQGALYIDDLDD